MVCAGAQLNNERINSVYKIFIPLNYAKGYNSILIQKQEKIKNEE